MKEKQYEVSAKSFERMLDRFVRKSAIAMIKNSIPIPWTLEYGPLINTYKRAPNKNSSSVKIFSKRPEDVVPGGIDYIQISYIFNGSELIFKTFIKRHQRKKTRFSIWEINNGPSKFIKLIPPGTNCYIDDLSGVDIDGNPKDIKATYCKNYKTKEVNGKKLQWCAFLNCELPRTSFPKVQKICNENIF